MADRRRVGIEERKDLYEKLRIEIIKLYYNVLVARYRERWKTMELMMRNYWWHKVTKNVGKYVNRYNLYQKMKNKTEVLAGNLIVNKILNKLWTYLTVDFITKLPLVARKNTILVIYNRLFQIGFVLL